MKALMDKNDVIDRVIRLLDGVVYNDGQELVIGTKPDNIEKARTMQAKITEAKNLLRDMLKPNNGKGEGNVMRVL